jgi:cytochrome c-type biogenesis protein CcmH
MWDLYAVMALLTAVIALKLMHPLLRRGAHRGTDAATHADRKLAGAIMCSLPVAALGIYMTLGRPDLEGAPAIFRDPGELAMRQDALLSRRPMETLLKQNPDDIGAIVKLATINHRLGRFSEAVKYMRRAVILAQQQDNMLLRMYATHLGRMQVLANKGIVGPDALGTFDYVRSINPIDPIARYFQALARAQQGDAAGAIEEWTQLLSQGTPLAYWKQNVREAIAVTKAGRLGAEPLNFP